MSDLLEEIKAYAVSVKKSDPSCTTEVCSTCGKTPDKFNLHDRRKRSFLVIVDRLIHKIITLLFRWKCPICGASFTHYPDFALPFKRYVRGHIFKISQSYLEDKQTSYRKSVTTKNMGIYYGDSNPEIINERRLRHSTVSRWISTISKYKETTKQALRMIKDKSQTSNIFRKIQPIFPQKFQCTKRRKILQNAHQLLKTEKEYQALFKISIFPNLATGCGWT